MATDVTWEVWATTSNVQQIMGIGESLARRSAPQLWLGLGNLWPSGCPSLSLCFPESNQLIPQLPCNIKSQTEAMILVVALLLYTARSYMVLDSEPVETRSSALRFRLLPAPRCLQHRCPYYRWEWASRCLQPMIFPHAGFTLLDTSVPSV